MHRIYYMLKTILFSQYTALRCNYVWRFSAAVRMFINHWRVETNITLFPSELKEEKLSTPVVVDCQLTAEKLLHALCSQEAWLTYSPFKSGVVQSNEIWRVKASQPCPETSSACVRCLKEIFFLVILNNWRSVLCSVLMGDLPQLLLSAWRHCICR